MRSSDSGSICDIPGIRVGHYTDASAATGCTVVLCPAGTLGGVDVRGGAPGTRETDLLRPGNLVQEVHAVLLTGGSAFGLDAAAGVMRYLEERGIGYDAGVARVPIVAAAVLFDLMVGSAVVRPDAAAGYQACQAAAAGPVAEGSVGAGTGATVGKLLGPDHVMKGGIGTASLRLPSGAVVSALMAVNAVGDVFDPDTGEFVAGARMPSGGPGGSLGALLGQTARSPFPGTSTTIGVVATNALVGKDGVNKLAQMAHDGLALAVRPAHTMHDGDTIFSLATGGLDGPADVSLLGAAAAVATARAVVRAVRLAVGLAGIPSVGDLLMTRDTSIGFIGTGHSGTALAMALAARGYRVPVVASRTGASAAHLADLIPGCRAVEPSEVAETADLVFVTTPDDAIAGIVAQLDWRPGQAVVHCSGAASMDILESARLSGAMVGGFHPLQTFAAPEQAARSLAGTTFGLEAEEPLLGRLAELAEALGGRWIRLRPEDKALYHASAVLACNYLVTLVKLASDLWREFGVDPSQAAAALLPLVQGTVDNLAQVGLPHCLTGPISRGDLGTLRRHVTALGETSSDVLETYRSLGRQTVPIALAKGTISPERAAEMTALLGDGRVAE